MFPNSVFYIVFLFVVCPMIKLIVPVRSLPTRTSISGETQTEIIYNLPQVHMHQLKNRTVCPFIETEKATGGTPAIVFEYSCVSSTVTSDTVNNSVGRCRENHECIQGTTTIQIQMPNKNEPTSMIFNSGCFCAKQWVSTFELVAPPKITY